MALYCGKAPMERPRNMLREYFGYGEFRPNQQEIVDALLAGRDVLAVMPTGAGKSICFQVPALCMDGYALVVSPLISLMKDQVEALHQAGVPASFVNSTLGAAARNQVLDEVHDGVCKLLYVSPERLANDAFRGFCMQNPPAMLAIDEAHCISQWGQDFRPEYAQINDFLDALPMRPVLGAFTATATPAVRDDIAHALRLRSPLRVVASFDRPNLHFETRRPANKKRELLEFCREHAGESGIVYCSSRRAVDEVSEFLRDQGVPAARYHAGLTDLQRRAGQDAFVYDRVDVIVATNAFGMGIDKSNVSFVVHYNMPLDVESYYQEAGRAGRDGQPARCVLLYASGDVHTCEFLIDRSAAEHPGIDPATRDVLLQRAHERLRQMTFYSTTTDCLRQFILRYFGEQAPGYCGNCGNCETEFIDRDVTVDAQKIVSCVYRLGQRDVRLGKTKVVAILRGSKSEGIVAGGFDSLSTYGIMAESSMHHVRFVLDALLERGILSLSDAQYPVVLFAQASGDFLRERQPLVLKVPKERPAPQPAGAAAREGAFDGGATTAGMAVHPDGGGLFEALRTLRLEIAQEEGVPAYIVFSNATLADMAARRPCTPDEFLQVSGVGAAKSRRYGERFLAAINDYLERRDEA